MSKENVEIVREMFAAWNRGDYAAAQQAFDPDVVSEMSLGTDIDGTYEGHEGLQRLIRFWGTFSEHPARWTFERSWLARGLCRIRHRPLPIPIRARN